MHIVHDHKIEILCLKSKVRHNTHPPPIFMIFLFQLLQIKAGVKNGGAGCGQVTRLETIGFDKQDLGKTYGLSLMPEEEGTK